MSARAGTIMIAAPAQRCTDRLFRALLPAPLAALAARIARETRPGDLGRAAIGFAPGDRSPRVAVAVLPDAVARYNSPARAESIRRAALALPDRGTSGLAVVLDDAAHALAAANAVAKALPRFSAKTGRPARAVRCLLVDPAGRALKPPRHVVATAEATRDAARLVDTPPSELGPAELARAARRLCAGLRGLRWRELAGPALARAGLRGILAVGRAASAPPRLLAATQQAPRRRGLHVALVGKGITYDTGGLHLKARGSMEGMKADMGGAAAAIGAFRVLCATGSPHRVSLVLCIAENAIGPRAYKPDDILTMHSGKTVEINNTDAEGRLLLADGVSYAARVLGADVVLDAATLTGAQMVATGLLHAAVVSNDAEVERTLVEAGRASGDLAHPLPFAPEFYKHEFDSPVADMRNSVRDRSNAQPSCAAQFIYWHVEDAGVRWAHVDLAGPAVLKDRGTGFGVALLSEAVRRLA
jgi:probable aminopeptidase NPEPL1